MATNLRHGQQRRVFDALKAGNAYGLSDAALWRDIKAGKWDDHPSAGAPQGAPYKPPGQKGVKVSIYPTGDERDKLDALRGDQSRTEWLLVKAGIREES